MAEFKAGTREQVKNGQAQYVAGDIVSKDAINAVGGAATRTKAVTQVTGRSSSGRITDSQTVLYVEKNGTYQPAAIKKEKRRSGMPGLVKQKFWWEPRCLQRAMIFQTYRL